MLLDIGAWALILGIAYVGGDGMLALLGAHGLRRGDRFIIAAWLGVVALSELLLGASLVVALSPLAATACALIVCVVGGWLRWRFRDPNRRAVRDVPGPAVALGVAVIFLGAAALASDPVTLYDSLVYHLGLIRWLREHGTVPGVALLHNRLGHVSAWFALAAPFESSVLAGRAGNIAQGVALVLVALQGAIAAGRIGDRRAVFADWFLLVLSAALVCPVVVFDVATPSPDVVTNALIAVVAWSTLIVPRAGDSARAARHAINPRLVPFTLGVGAAAMKLFALPATAAAAIFYALGSADAATIRYTSRRLAVCVALGFAMLSPFLAANVVASGCPLFPSSIGCVDVGWSVGSHEAAEYSEYIRNVARFQGRHSFVDAAKLPWIGTWVAKSPIVSLLIVLSPIVAAVLLRRPRRRWCAIRASRRNDGRGVHGLAGARASVSLYLCHHWAGASRRVVGHIVRPCGGVTFGSRDQAIAREAARRDRLRRLCGARERLLCPRVAEAQREDLYHARRTTLRTASE